MSRIITGLCGEICAGKGMVESHLRKRYDCDYTRFSVPLARGLDALGVSRPGPSHTREDLQDISTLLRQGLGEVPQDGAFARLLRDGLDGKLGGSAFGARLTAMLAVFHVPVSGPPDLDDFAFALAEGFGEDILARTIDKDCEKSVKDCMIVDGVRRDADIIKLGQRPNFHSIYITAPIADRFEWAKARNEKAGDAELTWEKFLKQNAAETEREIPTVGAKAHLILRNGKHRRKEDVLAELDAYLDRVDAA